MLYIHCTYTIAYIKVETPYFAMLLPSAMPFATFRISTLGSKVFILRIVNSPPNPSSSYGHASSSSSTGHVCFLALMRKGGLVRQVGSLAQLSWCGVTEIEHLFVKLS